MELLGSIGSAIIGGIGKLIGGKQDADAAAKLQAQNIANQKEFAQNAIQWKVADAKAAGVHPLFGLGASTGSFTPVSSPATDMAGALGEMGQGIGRAAGALASGDERKLMLEAARLDVENKKINNDIGKVELASKMQRLSQPGTPPGFPNTADISPREILAGGGGKKGQEMVKITPDTRQAMKFGPWEPRITNAPDAQIAENRYGDVVQNLYGIGLLGADAWNALYPYVKRYVEQGFNVNVAEANKRMRRSHYWRVGN